MYPFPGGYLFVSWDMAASNLTPPKTPVDRAGSISFSSLAGAATRAVADRRGSSRTLQGGLGGRWKKSGDHHVGMVLKPCK